MTKSSRQGSGSADHTIVDEPGMAERFQRGLQRAFQTPHKPITPKAKMRLVNKGRVHKGKTGR